LRRLVALAAITAVVCATAGNANADPIGEVNMKAEACLEHHGAHAFDNLPGFGGIAWFDVGMGKWTWTHLSASGRPMGATFQFTKLSAEESRMLPPVKETAQHYWVKRCVMRGLALAGR
jgi:hypothetical protein